MIAKSGLSEEAFSDLTLIYMYTQPWIGGLLVSTQQ